MSTPDTKTDDSKLVTTDTVYVSPDGGTTDEAFPKPNVEYAFCVDVTNSGELPSGPFFVRFTLSGDQDPPKDLDFAQDAGLDARAKAKAVVHFGTFPNQSASYYLEAGIYSSSAPETLINSARSFGFPITVNTASTSDSGSGTASDTTSASDSTSDTQDSTTEDSQ